MSRAAGERVRQMLVNGKPIDQIVAESQWTRRAVEALARYHGGMLIHPDTGVAYDPRLPEERVADTYKPRPAEKRREPRAVQAAEQAERCVHDRLLGYGLEHSRIGVRRTAERIQRDLAMVAAAAHGDRARAEAYERRVAEREAAEAISAVPPSTRFKVRADEIASLRGVDLTDIRDWCFVRGLCGRRGVMAMYALDQYEDAHPIRDAG